MNKSYNKLRKIIETDQTLYTNTFNSNVAILFPIQHVNKYNELNLIQLWLTVAESVFELNIVTQSLRTQHKGRSLMIVSRPNTIQ